MRKNNPQTAEIKKAITIIKMSLSKSVTIPQIKIINPSPRPIAPWVSMLIIISMPPGANERSKSMRMKNRNITPGKINKNPGIFFCLTSTNETIKR